MVTQKIVLNNAERFTVPHNIDRQKLTSAAEKATDKLEANIKKYGSGFPTGGYTKDFKYTFGDKTDWMSGMYTGCLLLAYEMTGNKLFKDVAESQLDVYESNLVTHHGMDTHDVGFTYSPSCVTMYKLFGNERARKIALDAAEYFYEKSYNKEGKFILRAWRWEYEGYRTMMDTLLNAPLLYWAGKETGRDEYFEAAHNQALTTEKYLVREDASTFHHYQFDPETNAPVKGVTWQGYSDDSCWGRGHAWGVMGFPIAYAYTKDDKIKNVHRDITYYLLNNIPDNDIPYWDFIFKEPSDVPRDSSSVIISSCGLDLMSKLISPDAEEKKVFENASSMLLETVIDRCTQGECDGLINRVTHALPQGIGIEQCAVYGDYFYLEALMRKLNPNWKMYW